MTKSELNNLIESEVKKQLAVIVPKIVKPLVKEAVAGALAALLAEGIVKGPPAKLTVESAGDSAKTFRPTSNASLNVSRGAEGARAALRSSYQLAMEADTTPVSRISPTGNPITDILNQTAAELHGGGATSVLDSQLPPDLNPETADAITRNYSALMQRLNKI